MGSKQDYILDDFPINTSNCNFIYGAISRAMYNRENPGIRGSGLYGTHSFYTPKSNEVLPILFGTLFNGDEYAEVLFLKSHENENGKLEVKLFGDNEERLLEIKKGIKLNIDRVLEKQNA